jgi:hypothetical protein
VTSPLSIRGDARSAITSASGVDSPNSTLNACRSPPKPGASAALASRIGGCASVAGRRCRDERMLGDYLKRSGSLEPRGGAGTTGARRRLSRPRQDPNVQPHEHEALGTDPSGKALEALRGRLSG